MWAIIGAIGLVASGAGPYPGVLEGRGLVAQARDGHVDTFLVDPSEPAGLVAIVGEVGYRRLGPGHWEPSEPRTAFVSWSAARPAGARRLPTGQLVEHAVTLAGGYLVGSVPGGIVESDDDFRHVTGPTPLAPQPIAAAAADPKDPDHLLLAGARSGMYECRGAAEPCERVLEGRFFSGACFADDTRLAGDEQGVVWRWDTERGWEPHALRGAPIVGLNGVPDGGPRHALDANGESWRSEDHGLSWGPAPPATGRLGSGGMLARVRDDGSLEVIDIDGRSHLPIKAGQVPKTAPVRWAGPDHVVVGLADGAFVVERGRWIARRLTYADNIRRPFLDATVDGDEVVILAADPAGVLRFVAPKQAPATVEGLIDHVKDSSSYLVLLVVLLGLLWWWIQRRLKALIPKSQL